MNIMKKALICFAMLMCGASGSAFSQSCASIGDSDQRAYCYAKQRNGSCASIGSSDLRAQCYAEKR